MATTYNPAAQYQLKVWDVEFRRAPKRTLMARIYQPQGAGPFPTLLDVVNHYDSHFKLNLSEADKKDLVEYLKGI